MENSKQPEGNSATVIGATGLIGSYLVQWLGEDSRYNSINVVVRRPVQFDHPKIKVNEIDFEDSAAYRSALENSHAIFCAVGTTTRKVKGDRKAYRKVDVDIPLHAAQACEEIGCPQFLLVSSIGASSGSSTFYLRLKGEVEDALSHMAIPSVSVFRPSLLLGERNEQRLGERIAQRVMGPLSFAVPSNYRPIQAADVARAMVAASHQQQAGIRFYHYSGMMELIESDPRKQKQVI